MTSTYFINGKFLKNDQAVINVKDLGILRGYGIFDYLRTYNGIPFHLEDHLDRLYQSAKYIDLKIPWSRKQLTDWINKTLKKNNFPESAIRIILTGGPTKDTMSEVGDPTIIIIVDPAAIFPDKIYANGVCLKTFPLTRYFPEAKTISYIPAVIIHKRAQKDGYYDGIYLDKDNNILEAANSNLFFFIKNKLITPKKNILFGITRKVIINLLKNDFKVSERPVNLTELPQIKECFLCVSSKGIVPVVKIDKVKIGSGQIGNNTRKIMEIYNNYTSNYR